MLKYSTKSPRARGVDSVHINFGGVGYDDYHRLLALHQLKELMQHYCLIQIQLID